MIIVNPRSVEWIISLHFFCSESGAWGRNPQQAIASRFHDFCGNDLPCLLGLILSIKGLPESKPFCFVFSLLFSSGSQGWNPLASSVSEHSNLRFCNAEIPSLLGKILILRKVFYHNHANKSFFSSKYQIITKCN